MKTQLRVAQKEFQKYTACVHADDVAEIICQRKQDSGDKEKCRDNKSRAHHRGDLAQSIPPLGNRTWGGR